MRGLKSRWLCIALSVGFILFTSTGLTADAPPEILKAARKGLNQFLGQENLPPGFPHEFSELNSIKHIKIGYGFEMFTVSPDSLAADQESTLQGMLRPTGVWRFVVNLRGQAAALLTVAQVQGNWAMVSIGGAGLAKEVNRVTAAWPEKNGYKARFVRVFQAKSDFMEISRGTEPMGFVLFKSARIALQMDRYDIQPSTLVYQSEFIETLREMVGEEMLRQPGAAAQGQPEVR